MRAVNDRPYILKVENILDKMRATPVACCSSPAGRWRYHTFPQSGNGNRVLSPQVSDGREEANRRHRLDGDNTISSRRAAQGLAPTTVLSVEEKANGLWGMMDPYIHLFFFKCLFDMRETGRVKLSQQGHKLLTLKWKKLQLMNGNPDTEHICYL